MHAKRAMRTDLFSLTCKQIPLRNSSSDLLQPSTPALRNEMRWSRSCILVSGHNQHTELQSPMEDSTKLGHSHGLLSSNGMHSTSAGVANCFSHSTSLRYHKWRPEVKRSHCHSTRGPPPLPIPTRQPHIRDLSCLNYTLCQLQEKRRVTGVVWHNKWFTSPPPLQDSVTKGLLEEQRKREAAAFSHWKWTGTNSSLHVVTDSLFCASPVTLSMNNMDLFIHASGCVSIHSNLQKAQLSLLPKTGIGLFIKKKTNTKYSELMIFNMHLISN